MRQRKFSNQKSRQEPKEKYEIIELIKLIEREEGELDLECQIMPTKGH